MLPSMKGVLREGFYDLTLSWKDTIGGSNCLIAKNKNEWDYVKEKNPKWYESLMNNHVDSIVLFPLTFNDEILGYIWACNFDTENTVKIKQTLELTTFFISSHIARYKVLKRLEHMSYTDALTGLPNRFACTDYITSLVSRRETFAAVSLDLNNFKSVNDTFGFDAGNQVLIDVANRWRA